MTGRRLRVGAAIAIGALLAARLPAAADAVDAYGAALRRAVAAKERALDANDPPRWEEALRLFQEAAALSATREATYEIGFAAERLARADLAVESYEAALELGLAGPAAARASAFVGAHVRALSRLDVRGPAGTRLRIAGIDRGRLPLSRPLVMFPGETTIEIVDPAGLAWTVTARLKGGKNDVIDLAAAPLAEAPAPAPSRAAPRPVPAPPRAAPPPAPLVAPRVAAAPPPAAATPPAAPPPAAPAPAAPPPAAAAPPSEPLAPVTLDEPGPRTSSRAAWPLVVGGAVVAVAGVVLVAVSQGKIEDSRMTLMGACMAYSAPDTCKTAKPGTGEQATAQTAVNDILTWKSVRLGAAIGAGFGAAVAVTGVVLKLVGSGARPPLTATLVTDRDGRPSVGVAWSLRF